jgi:hypothetical protein
MGMGMRQVISNMACRTDMPLAVIAVDEYELPAVVRFRQSATLLSTFADIQWHAAVPQESK